jgi:hypothetical protein
MKNSAIPKSVVSMLVAVLCLSLLAPGAGAADRKKTSEPGSEGSTISRETEGSKARPETSNQPSPQPLSEEETAETSARAEDPGPEVAGGALSNLHLTYIVIALAAAVLVLVLK